MNLSESPYHANCEMCSHYTFMPWSTLRVRANSPLQLPRGVKLKRLRGFLKRILIVGCNLTDFAVDSETSGVIPRNAQVYRILSRKHASGLSYCIISTSIPRDIKQPEVLWGIPRYGKFNVSGNQIMLVDANMLYSDIFIHLSLQ